ncbi:MAG: Asp-tRNA(Asn)/Glu-tRNA(Gln) amidotransferase subunit GatC [Clostridiales bacterium]|jgi:aspartyl-tRNA(Asn)/glutamyl-tRNA(Gln) amidotransferase subunit C|nr:Asp-tRNA(Asn)/Glu-tRNA(Gln) amidotransferase subunit GatC [Clostridiales bacterium]
MNRNNLLLLEKVNQLGLNETERNRLLEYFGRLWEEEKKLGAFDIAMVERMVHVVDIKNVLREDESKQPFSRESLLEGAPEHTDSYWQAPRLIE